MTLTTEELIAEASQAAREAGFGDFDEDCTPAKVIRTLYADLMQHEREIIEIERALGGCRPPLVLYSRVGNILAYIETLRKT